jgi:putative FmdB family regulatory protein
MRRIFEFVCSQEHKFEALVDDSVRTTICPHCGSDADRIVSAPTMKLEAYSGAFPTAYDAWNRKRAEKLKQEQKANA